MQYLFVPAADLSCAARIEGILGCGKSALCKVILDSPGVLGDDRPVHSLMGDLVKGQYWAKVDEACRRKPSSILLADKNAPNEEVWSQIEEMCGSVITYAVPVITDTEGTETNPYSLDALAVFAYHILRRANHPGNLDKNSQNVGYVLLLFYCLYEGKSKADFELELVERFGSLVRMPLLKLDRYYTDPLGTFWQCNVKAIGSGSEGAGSSLQERYNKEVHTMSSRRGGRGTSAAGRGGLPKEKNIAGGSTPRVEQLSAGVANVSLGSTEGRQWMRCGEIGIEKHRRLTSDEGWLSLMDVVQVGPVPGFGKRLSSILENYLSD